MDEKKKTTKSCPPCKDISRIVLVSSFAVGILFLVAGLLLHFLFPVILKAKIASELELREGSEAMDRFEKFPVASNVSVYLFNVTNPDEVNAGHEKPNLQEVGPFVYKLYKRKEIQNRDDVAGTITYRELPTFYYQPDLSVTRNPARLPIYHVNAFDVGLANLLAPLRYSIFSAAGFLSRAGYKLGPYIVKHTADELIFGGYRITLLDWVDVTAGLFFTIPSRLPNNTFGLLYGKNHTLSKNMTIMSGLNGIERLGELIEFNNAKALPFWKPNTTCSALRGTDGIFFAPNVDKTMPLNAFNPDLCRTVQLYYQRTETYKDIETYRYSLPKAAFETSVENNCFCMTEESEHCKSGVMSIKTCLDGSPVALSAPHFYMADPMFLDHFTGLSPDVEKHGSFLNLEPMTGLVVRGKRRIQVNAEIQRLENVQLKHNRKVASSVRISP